LIMNSIFRYFYRIRRRRRGLPVLQSFKRQQEKIRKLYSNVVVGFGTYGVPTVHDSSGGTLLRIGSYCSIASGVQVFLGSNHRTDWVSSYPFPAFFDEVASVKHFVMSRGDVTVGSDVWLCANCMILSGVTIGHGAVVGAGAVVTRDVEPYSVVAGNPAKHVRWRFDEATRRALLEAAWWDWPVTELRGVMELLCSDQIHRLLDYAQQRPERVGNSVARSD